MLVREIVLGNDGGKWRGNESLINSKKLQDQKVDLMFQPWKQGQN